MYNGRRMAVIFGIDGNARVVWGRATYEEDRDLGSVLSMLFRTRERSPRIGIDSSITSAILEVRGKSVRFGLPAPSEISIRREAAELSERIEAEQLLPRDVRRLIDDALSNGRPLGEVEDYLDWLENTCPSAMPA